jgi:hypothetical protein
MLNALCNFRIYQSPSTNLSSSVVCTYSFVSGETTVTVTINEGIFNKKTTLDNVVAEKISIVKAPLNFYVVILLGPSPTLDNPSICPSANLAFLISV